MRNKIISLLALFGTLFSTGAYAQSDYYVAHGANVNVSHATHYPKAVSIEGSQSPEQVLQNIASAPRCQAYFDKTSTTFEVLVGEVVTPNISINGEWMHGYVYVDWNQNKQFDVNLEGAGPYTKGAGNELMCWSLYSKGGNGDSGWNSDGVYLSSGNVLTPGSFKVPADAEIGTSYRMRYKVEWNSIDPAGSGNKFLSDGGAIIDVMLKVTGKAAEGVDPYGHEELVAELSSGLTGLALGIEQKPQKNNIAYLKCWLENIKQDPQYIFNCLTDAKNISRFMCEKVGVDVKQSVAQEVDDISIPKELNQKCNKELKL